MSRITAVVSQKGTPMACRRVSCKILTTRYSRAVAPSVRETMKIEAPVRYERGPRRCSR